ncbi:hypothetical protein KGF56_001333 [Candida oxycetoniae]|uniref:Acyl-CoA thioesterase-like C-terminal domain-containing protein n=1 Tax=Candida oxycetoniae TaxID=497107 RepID=A0AAI9SZ82_9ASCO|nr:uncharacterized protein KGF56_001333 [Candida oxycetoniae]KAI3405727.1 hypothetical protein KGF56_001333 [Candida oxycetoniae]
MDKLKKEVYNEDNPVAKMEAKASVRFIRDEGNKVIYEGVYPVEPFREDARGTYGGDFITQGLNACWESVGRGTFQPHSLHSYFVKPGSVESNLRWEILKISDSRNFSNRLALAYQIHTNQLVFTLQASFTKENDLNKKEEDYLKLLSSGGEIKAIPFHFKRSPNKRFFKYKDQIDDLMYFEHTNNNIAHAVPLEIFQYTKNFNMKDAGNEELALFVKVLDDYSLGKDQTRQSFLGLAFESDALWLATLVKAIGLPLGADDKDFFRVSLDHSLYFHDLNFDSSKWLYLDYRFLSMGNNRILAVVNFYTLEGKAIATAVQEAYGFLPKQMIERSRKLHEKYNSARNEVTESAKL